jgi:plastocyanin
MNFRKLLWSLALFSAAGSAVAANQSVTVGPNNTLTFSPATVTINKGESVTFTYAGGTMPHNVAANDGSFRNGNATSAAFTFTHTFNTAGSVGYFCEIHGSPGAGMHGTVIVNDVAPPPAQNINGGISGNWFDPTANQGGHGFQIEVLPNNGMLAIWFVFNPAGTAQNWIYSQGSYDPTSNTTTLPAFLEQGGTFPPHFDSSKLTAPAWGSLQFTFTDCNNGTVNWKSNATSLAAGYGDVTIPIQRLTNIAGTTCP